MGGKSRGEQPAASCGRGQRRGSGARCALQPAPASRGQRRPRATGFALPPRPLLPGRVSGSPVAPSALPARAAPLFPPEQRRARALRDSDPCVPDPRRPPARGVPVPAIAPAPRAVRPGGLLGDPPHLAAAAWASARRRTAVRASAPVSPGAPGAVGSDRDAGAAGRGRGNFAGPSSKPLSPRHAPAPATFASRGGEHRAAAGWGHGEAATPWPWLPGGAVRGSAMEQSPPVQVGWGSPRGACL